MQRMLRSPAARAAASLRLRAAGAVVPATHLPHNQTLRQVATQAIVLPEGVPVEALYVGGAALAASLLGLVGWQSQQAAAAPAKAASGNGAAGTGPATPPRENAVMVLGATGRVGRRLIQRLLASGRTVVAAVRSGDKARSVLCEQMGLREGWQQPESRSGGVLVVEEGVDVTQPASLDRPELWRGVTQVVSLLGPVFGPQPGGGMGYIDNMSPERVEAEGAASLAAAAAKHLKRMSRTTTTILPMRSEEDMQAWQRLDDVIMGGQSSSGLAAKADGSGAVWRGDLIVEGGGFCGARSKALDLDLTAYDGIHLRVRGDGQTFKLNIKTTDQMDTPESTYQTTFDTVAGQWHDAYIPWHNFVPVKRAQSDPFGRPLDPSAIQKFGLVLSRFEFNKVANPDYRAGPYELEIEGGLNAYTDVRPQLVMLSCASVERNAIIGDDAEARKKDIPIVQLNPGGTLNHKYAGEMALRSVGLPYAVVRSTGMIDSQEGAPFLIEADQGDTISGVMGRDDTADVLCAALTMPEAAGKTFEVRRSEAIDGRGRSGPMVEGEWRRMFLRLALDKHRWRVGLPPMPRYVAPPTAPVTEERRDEVLQDVARVREKLGTTPAEQQQQQPPQPAAPKELAAAGARK